jgi:hypothetical protein
VGMSVINTAKQEIKNLKSEDVMIGTGTDCQETPFTTVISLGPHRKHHSSVLPLLKV